MLTYRTPLRGLSGTVQKYNNKCDKTIECGVIYEKANPLLCQVAE